MNSKVLADGFHICFAQAIYINPAYMPVPFKGKNLFYLIELMFCDSSGIIIINRNMDVLSILSLMQVLEDETLIADPNYVKVAVDKNMNSLFFSRSVIPFPRNKNIPIVYYEHIGVYAFRKEALMSFTQWPVTPLEDAEKIECLRYLENGILLRMVVTDYMGVEIDTPEDLARAEQLL